MSRIYSYSADDTVRWNKAIATYVISASIARKWAAAAASAPKRKAVLAVPHRITHIIKFT